MYVIWGKCLSGCTYKTNWTQLDDKIKTGNEKNQKVTSKGDPKWIMDKH